MDKLSAESIAEIETILLQYVANQPEPQSYEDIRDEGYKHRFWDMARELKGVSGMASPLPGYLAVPIMQQVLNARGLALTALGYDSEDEAIDDLECLWDKVKLSFDEAPLDAAFRMAREHPLRIPTRHISSNYQTFLNVAYYLQYMRGEAAIALPTEKMGDKLGVDPSRITDYRAYAKAEGYLKEVGKARFCTGGKGRATQFVFCWNGTQCTPSPSFVFKT